jgi:hypothetical protein
MFPISPTTEDTLTIRPVPRWAMCAKAAWDKKKEPERLTDKTVFQSSSLIAATGLSMVIPALLTRMSSRPWVSITSPMVRRQSAAEPTFP